LAPGDAVSQPDVLEARHPWHEEQQVHAGVVGGGEGVQASGRDQQVVARPQGEDLLAAQHVQAAVKDEKDLRR